MTPGLDLAAKRAASLDLLRSVRDRFAPAEIVVAWTGGKDSTVALDLWRTVLKEGLAESQSGRARVLNLDTGLKFPEVVAFRDTLARDWDLDLIIARPGLDLAAYPVARDKTACCRDLKIAPLSAALARHSVRALITGVRRDEHQSRAGRKRLEDRVWDNGQACLEVNPILDWTEMDVWSHIAEAGLPYCSLYGQGYRSLGCMPCTVLPTGGTGAGEDERAGRDPDKEAQLGLLRDLGYF